MKRKRSPSPSSHSQHSTRSTRSAPNSPNLDALNMTTPKSAGVPPKRTRSASIIKRDHIEDEDECNNSDLRRSGRQRKLSYPCYDPSLMTEVIKYRSQIENDLVVVNNSSSNNKSDDVVKSEQEDKDDEEDEEVEVNNGRSLRSRHHSHLNGTDNHHNNHTDEDDDEDDDDDDDDDDDNDEDEDDEYRRFRKSTTRKRRKSANQSPPSRRNQHQSFVRFSPSAKPGSPAQFSRRRRSLRRVQLHNLPSEDEQTEFNRRYSRDLRTRRKNLHQQLSDVEADEDELLRRRSTRTASLSATKNLRSQDRDEETTETDEEDMVVVKPRMEKVENEEEVEIRRSSRINNVPKETPTTSEPDDDEEEEEEQEEEIEEEEIKHVEGRPKRSRIPVQRLNYAPPEQPSNNVAAERRSKRLQNLDQYSSEDEFTAPPSRSRSRRTRYNMRERRSLDRIEVRSKRPKKKKISYKDRSSSSSSSSDEDLDQKDEQRFQKRKTKRMALERAKMMPINFQKGDIARSIFRDRQKVGTSLADVCPMEMDMNVKFESVGGCEEHINSLKEMVVFPLIYPEVFSKFSITPPRGVLFYGPPGTGKTLMARALASECSRDGKKVAFFMRKGADCLSKWIGESERQLRLLFDQAYLMRPSIIFFDEIDGLAPVRSSRQDQIHSSIVSTLLALMDGLDSRGEIIVIGATNRIENIDPALRRPGRFDRELRFGLPTLSARKEILTVHTKSWIPPVETELLQQLSEKTIGYCGADIKGLCAEAALNALRRRYPQVYKTNQKLAIQVDDISINDQDFFKAMKTMVPSTHRVQDQNQSPLPSTVRPLLASQFTAICQEVDKIFPCHKKDAESQVSFRPRILIRGEQGQGLTTYFAPAVLHYLEKIPCHKLDIPALFSNSARSPEEALYQIFQEAKRTIPSLVYMPHINRLWNIMTESVRATFVSLLGDVMPTSPLLIVAVIEDEHDFLEELFSKRNKEIFTVELPTAIDRKEFFQPLMTQCTNVPKRENGVIEGEKVEEDLAVVPVKDCRKLTEKEEKRLRKKEERLQRELRIFLRDIWAKINKEQKFFMFRLPVDTEEVYDYLDLVENPMDFDQMLSKLDEGCYKCAQDFLDDIDLIAENALTYNSDLKYETNKVICHRARALQDFCYALVKAEMDTDFEDECKEIVSRRKKLTEELHEVDPESSGHHVHKRAENGEGNSTSQQKEHNETLNSSISMRKKKPRKRTSNWARGQSKSSKKKVVKKKEENEEEECEDENNEDGDDDMMDTTRDDSNILADEEDEEEAHEESSNMTNEELVPTVGVRIDQNKLNQVHNELVMTTEGFNVERLERIYTRLSELISGFSKQTDRTKLPGEMQALVQTLKSSSVSSPQQQHHHRRR